VGKRQHQFVTFVLGCVALICHIPKTSMSCCASEVQLVWDIVHHFEHASSWCAQWNYELEWKVNWRFIEHPCRSLIHMLSFRSRISLIVRFKIAILAYQVLHRLAPQYLGPLNHVADLPGRRSLRSADTSRLIVPPVRLSPVANRAYPVVGPLSMSGTTCRPMWCPLSQWTSEFHFPPATENPSLFQFISRIFLRRLIIFLVIS